MFDHHAGLAGSGRPPEHHGVELASFDRLAQRFAAAQQMRLANEFVQVTWPHAVCQRAELGARRRRCRAAGRYRH